MRSWGLGTLVLIVFLVAPVAAAEDKPPSSPFLEDSPYGLGSSSVDDYDSSDENVFVLGPGDTLTRGGLAEFELETIGESLLIEGGLHAHGTPGQPVDIRVPVIVNASGPESLVVRHAVFNPEGSVSACALEIRGFSATVENSIFTEAQDGLCIHPKSSPASLEGVGEVDAAGSGEWSWVLFPFVSPDFISEEHPRYDLIWETYDAESGPNLAGLVDLVGNQYVGNQRAGLQIGESNETGLDPSVGVTSTGEGFRGNVEGLRTEYDQAHVLVEDGVIERNDVGLEHRGGRVALDHVVFERNRDWDVYSTGSPGDFRWAHTSYDPSCVQFEGRESLGCERDSMGVPLASLVFALISSALFFFSEAGRYLLKRIGFGLGLYSRIPKEEVLAHSTRRRLFDAVCANPGAAIVDLGEELNLRRGTAVYHLMRLEEENFLTSRREGIYRRFFPVDGEWVAEPKSTREQVLQSVVEEPGIHAAEIARTIGVSRQVASYHTGQLREEGSLTARKNDHIVHLYPGIDSK